MPQFIINGLAICFLLLVPLVIDDFLRHRSWRRLLIYALCIASASIAAFVVIDSPFGYSARPFGGGASPLIALTLMFFGVLFGIAATYVFNFTGAFLWRDLARPLVVSPLVLLPLIGSLQGAALEPVQLICFVVLAFQNGFFWQQVLRDAKPNT